MGWGRKRDELKETKERRKRRTGCAGRWIVGCASGRRIVGCAGGRRILGLIHFGPFFILRRQRQWRGGVRQPTVVARREVDDHVRVPGECVQGRGRL